MLVLKQLREVDRLVGNGLRSKRDDLLRRPQLRRRLCRFEYVGDLVSSTLYGQYIGET